MLRYELRKLMRERLLIVVLVFLAMLDVGYLAIDLASTKIGTAYSYRNYLIINEDFQTGRVTSDDLATRMESMSTDKLQYTDTVSEEYHLYETVLKEWQQIEEYSDYLQEVETASDRILISKLMQTSKASVKNAKKTKEDFAGVKGVIPDHAQAEGIALLLTDRFGDYLILLMLFLLTAGLVCSEIEEGRMPLLRSTVKGRARLLAAKYIVGLSLYSLLFLMVSLTRLSLIYATYGIPKAPAQSVAGLQDCAILMNCTQLLIKYYAGKWLALLALYSLLFAMGWMVRNTQLFYPVGLAMVGVSEFLYRTLDPTGHLSLLKWLNPLALLDCEETFHYRNLFLGEMVISYPIAAKLAVCGIIMLCMPISLLFSTKAEVGGRLQAVRNRLYIWRRTRKPKVRSTTAFERKKWLIDGKGFLMLMGVVVLLILLYDTPSKRLYTDEEISYFQYMEQVKGAFSEAKLDNLKKAYDKLESPEKRAGLEKIIAYGEYLETEGASDFVYEKGYEALLGKADNSFLYICFRLAAMLAMTACGILIWHIDVDTGMYTLINATVTGPHSAKQRKVVQTMQAAIESMFIPYTIWISRAFLAYPDIKLTISSNSLIMFQNWGNLPLWALVLLVLAEEYLVLVGIGILTGYLAEKTHNVVITATIATFVGVTSIILL